MTIQIDKNVPRTTRRKYPFKDMEVGDSFFAPDKTTHSMGGAIAHAKNTLGGQYAMRTVTENGVSGVRVWRTG